MQTISQTQPRSRQAAFDGADRFAERLSSFRVVETLHIHKHYGGTKFFWQTLQAVSNGLVHFPAFSLLLRQG